MAFSDQCSLCRMSVHCTGAGAFIFQVQCVVYTVQCVGCIMMSAKYEDLAVETG